MTPSRVRGGLQQGHPRAGVRRGACGACGLRTSRAAAVSEAATIRRPLKQACWLAPVGNERAAHVAGPLSGGTKVCVAEDGYFQSWLSRTQAMLTH